MVLTRSHLNIYFQDLSNSFKHEVLLAGLVSCCSLSPTQPLQAQAAWAAHAALQPHERISCRRWGCCRGLHSLQQPATLTAPNLSTFPAHGEMVDWERTLYFGAMGKSNHRASLAHRSVVVLWCKWHVKHNVHKLGGNEKQWNLIAKARKWSDLQ